jgi:hypothetical protein
MSQEVLQIVGPFAGMLITVLVSYAVAIVVIKPNPGKSTEAALARLALNQLGIDRAAWNTVIISSSMDVSVPLERLWETWACLDSWQDWSPLHEGARWVAGSDWGLGAKFEERLKYGFPFGKKTAVQTVTECIPMRQVRWCKREGGARYCHIWSFALMPNRKVRVSKTEVFHGAMFGLFKPVLVLRWQKLFEKSVKELVRAAQASA